MPQYDYRCKNCNEYFSIERSMNDTADARCSHCQSQDSVRIWNVQFMSGSKSQSKDKPQAKPQAHAHRGGCCGGGFCGS